MEFGSEYHVQKSQRTLLDELELLAEMTREECVFRMECQKKAFFNIREEIQSRKIAFDSIKRGQPPLTQAVARLRARWGGKRRAKRRQNLGTHQLANWDDDLPLPVRTGCGLQVCDLQVG